MTDDLLDFGLRTVGDATVLSVHGEVDMQSASEFSRGLREALSRGTPVVVVDLDGIRFLASTGLSELVRAAQQATAQGAAFRLAGGGRAVLRTISAAGLMAIFEHHDTVDAAAG